MPLCALAACSPLHAISWIRCQLEEGCGCNLVGDGFSLLLKSFNRCCNRVLIAIVLSEPEQSCVSPSRKLRKPRARQQQHCPNKNLPQEIPRRGGILSRCKWSQTGHLLA